MPVLRIDHVQLAMPRGREAEARRFYVDVLGLREIEKPPTLAARGGVWFELDDIQLHLGVDEDFRPARKAHVAFVVDDLDDIAVRCRAAGYDPRFDERVPSQRRAYLDDVFGNRLELVQAERVVGE